MSSLGASGGADRSASGVSEAFADSAAAAAVEGEQPATATSVTASRVGELRAYLAAHMAARCSCM